MKRNPLLAVGILVVSTLVGFKSGALAGVITANAMAAAWKQSRQGQSLRVYDDTPTDVIASWSEDATNVTFPIASVPLLTAAEADAATGSTRKIAYAMLRQLDTWYTALLVADQPATMTVRRTRRTDGENVVDSFKIEFTLDTANADVLNE